MRSGRGGNIHGIYVGIVDQCIRIGIPFADIVPLRVILGLFTALSGFELLYASLEFSRVLEVLFAAVNLSLALVGSYFIVKDSEGSAE